MGEELHKVECLGGPMDGKMMPIPLHFNGGDLSNACVMHMGDDGIPHFYILQTRVHDDLRVDDVLEYAGTSPYDVVDKLRNTEPELADLLESQLNGLDDVNQDTDE